MVEPVSPLAGHLAPGLHGLVGDDGPGLVLRPGRIGALWQVAAWPDRLTEAGAAAARAAGAEAAPGPGSSAAGTGARLLRTEPLKFWLVAEGALDRPAIDPADGVVTDLGHARTLLRIEGRDRAALMARLVALDLREGAFAEGAVAATGIHHVGVTLCRRGEGFDLYLPRSFARSLCDHVLEAAAQFGVSVGETA